MRADFKREHRREPVCWFDKYCIDQNDIDQSVRHVVRSRLAGYIKSEGAAQPGPPLLGFTRRHVKPGRMEQLARLHVLGLLAARRVQLLHTELTAGFAQLRSAAVALLQRPKPARRHEAHGSALDLERIRLLVLARDLAV